MNLHQAASGIVSAVNPQLPAVLRVSSGSTTDSAGKRVPAYETPGAISAAVAASVLTVASVTSGRLRAGQAVAGAGVAAGTQILSQINGAPGGIGDYQVNIPQTVSPAEPMMTSLTVTAQVQALSWRDLQMIDGLTLQGERRAIYLFGAVDGVSRPTNQGGDLITFPDGSIWLVALVLESWLNDAGAPVGWVKCACTLQNNA